MSSAGAHVPAPSPAPGPKATCPECGRPVASIKASQCLYCGKPLPNKVRPSVKAEEAAAVAEAFALLGSEPQSQGGTSLGQWAIRLGALGLGALLVFGLIGPCMRS